MQCLRIITLSLIFSSICFASDLDDEQAMSLKIEANHDATRIKSYNLEMSNNKSFDAVRESGLAEHLEDQSDFDLVREKGLDEYLKSKKQNSVGTSLDAYNQYIDERRKADVEYELARKKYVNTRDKFERLKFDDQDLIEYQELGLDAQRPRFEVVKRNRPNKWSQSAAISKGSPSGSDSGFQVNTPAPPPPDYNTSNDYTPPPAYESYEEPALQQPQLYDATNAIPYDPTFTGEGLAVPPPPPPPADYDF